MNNDNWMMPKVFTNAQLELLKMFSAKVPAEDWEVIRDYAKKYFAQKATLEMNKLFEENGWGEDKIEEWAGEHMRSGSKREELLIKAKKIRCRNRTVGKGERHYRRRLCAVEQGAF